MSLVPISTEAASVEAVLGSVVPEGPPDGTGARKGGPQAIGKSRRGWATRIHMATADAQTAVTLILSPGQAHDGPQGRKMIKVRPDSGPESCVSSYSPRSEALPRLSTTKPQRSTGGHRLKARMGPAVTPSTFSRSPLRSYAKDPSDHAATHRPTDPRLGAGPQPPCRMERGRTLS